MSMSNRSFDKPPIKLIDPDTGKKCKLALRKMSFSKETHILPSDLLQIHDLVIAGRTKQNEGCYQMVLAWYKLKKTYEKYWTSYGFLTEKAYLAYYDLPTKNTLDSWANKAELFDKATFTLLGVEVLDYMVLRVDIYQSELDQQKLDYQGIFDQYCSVMDSFEKTKFFEIVNQYLRKKYHETLEEKQRKQVFNPVLAAKEILFKPDTEETKTEEISFPQATTVAEVEVKSVPNAALTVGSRKIKQMVKADSDQQEIRPVVTHQQIYKNKNCTFCLQHVELINALIAHVQKTEHVIRRELGEQYLPKRAKLIEKIV